jgi:hypothetical protein
MYRRHQFMLHLLHLKKISLNAGRFLTRGGTVTGIGGRWPSAAIDFAVPGLEGHFTRRSRNYTIRRR